MAPIHINLAVEDALSEMVLRKILRESPKPFVVSACFCRGGFGYLKKNIRGFNHAARSVPFLMLADLDQADCPPGMLEEWLPLAKHHKFLFRIAVREVEAWLLAHREAFADFLGIQPRLIPLEVDAIVDPKRLLISLAKKSKKRHVREGIVPSQQSTAQIGPDYNGQLSFYVEKFWKTAKAAQNSPSLQHTVSAIADFNPRLKNKNPAID